VDLEGQLLLVDAGAQVSFFPGLADRALQRAQPGLHRVHQRVAHRPGAVVEFDGAADVQAPRIDLDGGPVHPVAKQRSQPRQAARLLHRRIEHLLLEARVVLVDDGDLEFLARAEVGEHARLAHAGGFGQRADRQPFQADLRRQRQRGVDDGGLGLLPLVQGATAPRRARRGNWRLRQGHGNAIKRTVVLFCLNPAAVQQLSLGAVFSARPCSGRRRQGFPASGTLSMPPLDRPSRRSSFMRTVVLMDVPGKPVLRCGGRAACRHPGPRCTDRSGRLTVIQSSCGRGGLRCGTSRSCSRAARLRRGRHHRLSVECASFSAAIPCLPRIP